MGNDFFVPFTRENKVLHIWDERVLPVITAYNDKYAVYSEERLSLRVDLCEMELFQRSDIYENGVPNELIEKRIIIFRDKKCLYSSLREILMDALIIFGKVEGSYEIGGCIIAQSGGMFLDISAVV